MPYPVGNTRPTTFTLTAPGRSGARPDGPVRPPAPAVEREGNPKPVVVPVAGVVPVAIRGAQGLRVVVQGPVAHHQLTERHTDILGGFQSKWSEHGFGFGFQFRLQTN